MEVGDEIERRKARIEEFEQKGMTDELIAEQYNLAVFLWENDEDEAAYHLMVKTIRLCDDTKREIAPQCFDGVAHIAKSYGDFMLAMHYWERMVEAKHRMQGTEPDDDDSELSDILAQHFTFTVTSCTHDHDSDEDEDEDENMTPTVC